MSHSVGGIEVGHSPLITEDPVIRASQVGDELACFRHLILPPWPRVAPVIIREPNPVHIGIARVVGAIRIIIHREDPIVIGV